MSARVDTPRDLRIQSRWSPHITTARYIGLFALVCLFLIPVYVLLVTAFKDPSQVSPRQMWELPETLSFDTFRIVWPKLENGLQNSLLMAIPASIISSLLGAANGFVLSKWRFPGADFVFPLILFGMFIPYQSILIPLRQVLSEAGLTNLTGLPPVHIIYGIPITTLIFRSYFTFISDELIDPSQVDGARMLRPFAFVALPIALPAFAVSIIWQFTQAWNDFLFGIVVFTRGTN